MLLLILFAFLAGIVTILSPCILPILPIILTGGVAGGKKRPLGIVTGFIAGFTFFTLTLTAIVKSTGISADLLRHISVVVIAGFGIGLLVPGVYQFIEKITSRLMSRAPQPSSHPGFGGGILLGLSLGLLWTPCVGPILAAVITLAATNTVNLASVFIALAYAIGTAIPMLLIIFGSRQLLAKIPKLSNQTPKIQRGFGIVMILTAFGIFFNLDRRFQAYIIQKFPGYGVGLTKLEDTSVVKQRLLELKSETMIDLNQSAPELIPGGRWFNTEPLTLVGLRGKVVLVDFWTYTCINCIRTLPYLNSWHEKYADKGLVIIGVHTPEFEFEKDPDNVAQAIADFDIKYPVMQDNDYATWKAYGNRYWPAKYFIDKKGKIRSTHFGEGDYDQSEKLIQDLLKEIGSEVNQESIHNQPYAIMAKTPETYLGYQRIDNFASREKIQKDQLTEYTLPNQLKPNQFAISGLWTLNKQYSRPAVGSGLTFNFEAEYVYLVTRPINNQKPGNIRVYLDEKPVNSITVDEDKLYELIHLPSPGRHLLRLEFLDENLELYAFTFG